MGWQAQRHGADRQKQGKGLCGFQFCFLEGIGSGCGTRSGSAACFSRTGNVTRVRDKRGAIFVRACKPGRQVCSAPETAELRTGCMAGDGKQAVETSGSKIAVTVFMPYCLQWEDDTQDTGTGLESFQRSSKRRTCCLQAKSLFSLS